MMVSKRKTKRGSLRNLAATIFQARYSPNSEDIDFSSNDTNLFLLVGPVAAGKSTLLEYLTPHVANAGLFHFGKDTTRKTRSVLDAAHTYVPVHDFENKRQAGDYFFTYQTHYQDGTGKPKRVRYGLPNLNLEKLKTLDGLLTLTDPNSFSNFLNVLEGLNIAHKLVPILLTSSTPNHLINRLAFRECSEEERIRRVLQAEPQWKHYNSIIDVFPHIILNDSPDELLTHETISDGDDSLKIQTYQAIDRAIAVLASIIHFYKRSDVTGKNVHSEYLNLVSRQFFGFSFDKLIVETKADRKIKFNQSYQSVGASSVTRQSLIEDAYIDNIDIKDGVAYVSFNKKGYDQNTMKSFLEAFHGAITGAGYNLIGVESSDGLEFSLSDRLFNSFDVYEQMNNSVYKIVLKYNGNSSGQLASPELKKTG